MWYWKFVSEKLYVDELMTSPISFIRQKLSQRFFKKFFKSLSGIEKLQLVYVHIVKISNLMASRSLQRNWQSFVREFPEILKLFKIFIQAFTTSFNLHCSMDEGLTQVYIRIYIYIYIYIYINRKNYIIFSQDVSNCFEFFFNYKVT